MDLSAYLVCHAGKIREKNEDNFLFSGRILENTEDPVFLRTNSDLKSPALFGVFDGMGGISVGERASQIAALTAKSLFGHASGIVDLEQLLSNICTSANSAICREMQASGKRMGTTASMLCFYENGFVLCNIGDSPIFILRSGKLIELSHEHTERETYEMLHGKTAEDGRKFKLTQHLGIFPEEMEIEPNIIPGQWNPQDRYLICSDGLTDMIQRAEICEILNNTSNGNAAERLLRLALRRGGKDNITFIVIEIGESCGR